jgi:hypothetical protein
MTEAQAREDLYERLYLAYYCEEITVREVIEPTFITRTDEKGIIHLFFVQGGSYLGSEWRPKQKQS